MNDAKNNTVLRDGCPVCGLQDFEAFNEHGLTTFNICPCCGCEAGYEYDLHTSNDHLRALRQHWIEHEKCRWFSEKHMPDGWNAMAQLHRVQQNRK